MAEEKLVVTIKRDVIQVPAVTEPDPGWRYVDKAGHEHRWAVRYGDGEIPTCNVHVEQIGYYPDGEPRYQVRYFCKECGEEIFPRVVPCVFPHYVPGPVHYFINGREVSKEEAETAIEKIRKMGREEDQDAQVPGQ